jgi:NMD protein affecting ribosome stability and mRNA decay
MVVLELSIHARKLLSQQNADDDKVNISEVPCKRAGIEIYG